MLAEEGIKPDLCWYNPNIHPYTEYRSRRDTLRLFAETRGLSLILEDEYGLRSFINAVENGNFHNIITVEEEENHRVSRSKEETEQNSVSLGDLRGNDFISLRLEEGSDTRRQYRCGFCYRLRLEKAARLAAEKGYDAFSTTLLISPYQNHDLIRETGEDLAARYGILFLYRDFRPRFRQGQGQARQAGYYMQKYCGCIYSEEERYLGCRPAGAARESQ